MNNNLFVLEFLLKWHCQTPQFCPGMVGAHTSKQPELDPFGGNIPIESSRSIAWKHFSGIYPPPAAH
jgi:hypothetical protein